MSYQNLLRRAVCLCPCASDEMSVREAAVDHITWVGLLVSAGVKGMRALESKGSLTVGLAVLQFPLIDGVAKVFCA